MILHVDMDAFFAAVEQLSDPRLKGKPVLICGDVENRSVVAAASYEARPFGVRAGMPAKEAKRLCPQAVFVPGNPGKYVALSLQILEVLKQISPCIEPMSIDEAFLDLAGTPWAAGRERAAAQWIQDTVWSRFQLTCSVGIGPNKLVAKMASGVEKPKGITAMSEAGFRQYFWGKPVTSLWGIGEKTASSLHRFGIHTVGDLALANPALLSQGYGVVGPRMRHAARGEDTSPVIPYFEGLPNKSMGHEHTLETDETSPLVLDRCLVRLVDQTTRRLRREGYRGRQVTLKLRFSDFTTWTRQRTIPEFTDQSRPVLAIARGLLRENWDGRAIRLLGVSVAQLLQNYTIDNLELWEERIWTREWVRAIDGIRDKFGDHQLRPAATI